VKIIQINRFLYDKKATFNQDVFETALILSANYGDRKQMPTKGLFRGIYN
jgi:hypothetical protein